jgi:hypothetical protein
VVSTTIGVEPPDHEAATRRSTLDNGARDAPAKS